MLFSAVVTLPLLAGSAAAGSRLWEVSISRGLEEASFDSKRAVSIETGDLASDAQIWPNKTLTYSFANTAAKTKLRGIFHEAQDIWAVLKDNGFKYKEVPLEECNAMRTKCLMIYYNNEGRLSSTVAIQPLDPKFPEVKGPTMHLSDLATVGNLDANVNAAHELGHAWGLFHEHQVSKWWKTSPEHQDKGNWPTYSGSIFHTNQFHCKNIKGYEEALARIPATAMEDNDRICTSYATAKTYNFNAMEWLPITGVKMNPDSEFDEDSLMLYPSGAGAKGEVNRDGDNRLPILTYAEGKLIPLRHGPSSMDIKKLISLYGSEPRGASMLYNAKGSSKADLFERIRSQFSIRAGHTKNGLC